MPEDRLANIKAMLAKLADADPERKVFGAARHGYSLHAPLPEARLTAFEKKHGIVLPDDYRGFLRHVGNGGAGPFYGLFRVGEVDDGYEHKRWKPGDFVGKPSAPFPYTEPWNWPADRIVALHADETGTLDREYWSPVDGAIPLVHEGCALRDWLVVSGPEAGHVWHDATAEFGGWRPWGEGTEAKKEHCMVWSTPKRPARSRRSSPSRARRRLRFLDWYETWIEHSLASIATG